MSEELNGFEGDYSEGDVSSDVNGRPAALQPTPQGAPQIIAAGADNTVVLPAGEAIESLEFDGRDLVIILSDGGRIVVPDGAIIIPQIVVEGTPIPPANIAALLVGNEPEPAAGLTPSSGGNFATDPGEIQSAFDLGDLLPYTELPQNEQPEEEIIPGRLNEEPEIVIETPDNPVGVSDAIATVSEAGLPAREDPFEPEGSDAASNGETTSGTIVFSAQDGLSAILINGVEITAVGQTFSSPIGTLTITSIDLATGQIGFSYTLRDNTLAEEFDGFFQATVIDTDGDEATASLQIRVIDDAPEGVNDADTVPGGEFGPIVGNVLDNDISGADGFPVDGGVTGFSNAGGSAAPGQSLQGTYGVLTLNADGSYTYVRDVNTPGDRQESFEYEIVDQDGSPSSAVLTITIEDADAEITFIPEAGEGTVVDEAGLPPRSDEPAGTGEIADEDPDNDSDTSEATSSTVTFNSPDGLASITINGVTVDPNGLPQTVVSDETGTLVITDVTYDPVTGDGTISYEYTLGDNTSGEDTSVDFEIVITDLDGDTASDTLTIDIVDDVPTANADTNSVTEGASVGGNVLTDTADVFGADGADAGGGVVGVRADGDPADVTSDVLTGVGAVIAGDYGTLTLNADGSYTYASTAGAVEAGAQDVFVYTIRDGDGDLSTTTLTIDVADVTLVADDQTKVVDEAALDLVADDRGVAGPSPEDDLAPGTVTGSQPGLSSETVTGQLAVAGTGVTYVLTGGSDAYGTLNLNADGSYTYTLTSPYSTSPAADDGALTQLGAESYSYTATDANGNQVSGTITIDIVDDVPTANAVTVSGQVDEDLLLPDGIEGGAGDIDTGAGTTTTIATGTSGNGNSAAALFNPSADLPLTITFADDSGSAVTTYLEGLALESGGVALSYEVSANGISAKAGSGGDPVFQLDLQSNGDWQFTLYAPLDHSVAGTEDDILIDFGPIIEATDGDGDKVTATGSLIITVDDDSPLSLAPTDGLFNNDPASPPVGVSLNQVIGADQPAQVDTISVDLTGLTVGGAALSGVQQGNVFTAYVDADSSGTFNAGDLEVFTITVDPTAGVAGEYVFDLIVPLDGETTVVDLLSDGAYGVGPSSSVLVSQDSTGDEISLVTGWDPVGNGGLLTAGELSDWLSGAIPDVVQNPSVNGSTAGFGLGNNNFDAGEFLRFDFGPLDDYDGAGAYTPPGGSNLQSANFATLVVDKTSSGDVTHFVAHYSDGSTEFITVTGSGSNSLVEVTFNAPPGATIAYIDAYEESGAVKLNIDDVGVTSTSVDIDIDVSLTLTDYDGDPVSGDFTINVFDDAPDAQDDLTDTTLIDQDINAAFVLDFSGSVDNRELNLQLNAVKDAAFELFETTTGTVSVSLVTFSGTAELDGTFATFEEFAAQLDSLNNMLGGTRSFSGQTDFTAAVQQVMADFVPGNDANNLVFFVSDGNPNEQTGTGGNSLLDSVASQWQTFIDDNNVSVTAIGVGNGINLARLQDVDLDGEGAPILADQFDDLVDTLVNTVAPPIGGNVLANDTPASNGIAVVSIDVDGVTYVFDGVNTITPSAGAPIAGTSFTVTTSFGGEFDFDFSDGSWTYKPSLTPVPEIENFQYVVSDNDGDTDSAILRIDIAAVGEASNFARNDVVISNAGASLVIDSAWLLANDNEGTSIDGISSFTGASSVGLAGGLVTFADDGSAGGSFTYSATDGSHSDVAFVTVNREQAGQVNLDGTSSGDILIGRAGVLDYIDGHQGADILFGGTGGDNFYFIHGDSLAVLSGSGNNGQVSGYDRVIDFDPGVDNLRVEGIPIVVANAAAGNGVDSTLTVNGQTIKSHAITDGMITFDDAAGFSAALSLNSEGDLAAAVDYLQSNDWGSGPNMLAFVAGGNTYIYYQAGGTPNPANDSLIELSDLVLTDLASLVPTVITPVVLDLDGGGNEFSSMNAGITYDYTGDGEKVKTAWIAAGSVILAFDANMDGTVTDASEFVFARDGMTDLEGLAADYDSNGDGVLDANDVAYGQFGIWNDANLDAVADPGEFVSLSDAGIKSIELVSDGIQSIEGDGDVTVYGTASYTLNDGSTGDVSDAAFFTGAEVDMAMMEALLMAGDGTFTGPTPDAADVLTIKDAMSDMLADNAVDQLVERFAPEAAETPVNDAPIDAAQLADALAISIDGSAFSIAPNVNEVSMDESGDHALMHG